MLGWASPESHYLPGPTTSEVLGMSESDRERILARFWSMVNKTETCWLWMASLSNTGYGQFRFDGHIVLAHRFVLSVVEGRVIEQGLTVDHLCRTPRCVNPSHLEVVSMRENVLRGTSPSAVAASRTECPQGHPYSGNNLMLVNGGRTRKCRICEHERDRFRYARKTWRTIGGPR